MSLETDIELLRKVALFSDFDVEHLRLLAFGSQKLHYSSGHELYHNGQRAKTGYVIMSGSIDLILYKNGQEDKRTTFGVGSLLGEMSLLAVTQRNATAVVREDCEVMKISRILMHRVLSEYPELAVALKRRISASVLEFANSVQKVRI